MSKQFSTYQQVYKAFSMVKDACFNKARVTERQIFAKTKVNRALYRLLHHHIVKPLNDDRYYWEATGMSMEEVISKCWKKFRPGFGPGTFVADVQTHNELSNKAAPLQANLMEELESKTMAQEIDILEKIVKQAMDAAQEFKIGNLNRYIAFRVWNAQR